MTVSFEEGNFHPNELLLPGLNFSHKEQYSFTFTESCIYQPIDWENDSNKLAGFSLGLLPRKVNGQWVSPHHYDSVRLAWNPELDGNLAPTGKVNLFRYLYQQGIRSQTLLSVLDIDTPYSTSIEVGKFYLDISGFGSDHGRLVHNFSSVSVGYRLNPYFGGNNPAPSDLHFELERS